MDFYAYPDVSLGSTVFLALKQLWGSIRWAPTPSLEHLTLREVVAEAKVCKLDTTSLIKEEVLSLVCVCVCVCVCMCVCVHDYVTASVKVCAKLHYDGIMSSMNKVHTSKLCVQTCTSIGKYMSATVSLHEAHIHTGLMAVP